MKLKEQFALDAIIKDRAKSLARPDLQENTPELLRRAKVLAALVACQEKITDIMAPEVERSPGNIDVDINLPPAASGAKPFQPFDGGDIAVKLKREIRKKTTHV